MVRCSTTLCKRRIRQHRLFVTPSVAPASARATVSNQQHTQCSNTFQLRPNVAKSLIGKCSLLPGFRRARLGSNVGGSAHRGCVTPNNPKGGQQEGHGDARTKWQGVKKRNGTGNRGSGTARTKNNSPQAWNRSPPQPAAAESEWPFQKAQGTDRREAYTKAGNGDITAGRTRFEARAHVGVPEHTYPQSQFHVDSKAGGRTGKPAKIAHVHTNTSRGTRSHLPEWFELRISRHGEPPRCNPQTHAQSSVQTLGLQHAPLR